MQKYIIYNICDEEAVLLASTSREEHDVRRRGRDRNRKRK